MNRDLIYGCIIGFVTGDALGTPLEFSERDAVWLVTEMEACYHYNLPVGTWSDRTGHMIALMTSLNEKKGYDSADYAKKYHQQVTHSTYNAHGKSFQLSYYTRLTGAKMTQLLRYKHDIPKSLNPEEIHQHDCEPLYRIGPIIALLYQSPKTCLETIDQAIVLTHVSQRCRDTARYLASLVIGCLIGVHKNTLLSQHFNLMDATTYGQLRFNHLTAQYLSECVDCRIVKVSDQQYRCQSNEEQSFLKSLFPAVGRVRRGSYREKKRSQIISDNNVVNCLEAVLWCFYQTDSFEEGCILACNLAANAPTIGAIYGLLAGSYYGQSKIPDKWTAKIHNFEKIVEMIKTLLTDRSS